MGFFLQARHVFPPKWKAVQKYTTLCTFVSFLCFSIASAWNLITYLDISTLNKESILRNICWKIFLEGDFHLVLVFGERSDC